MPDKTVKSSPKRERRDRTEEILKAATRLFSERGYRGTSLASIANEVQLTEPGLLHYFPSKVKLLEGVIEYREREDEQKYMEMINPENLQFGELLEALEQLVAENQEKPALIRLFTVLVAESIRHDHPSHDHFVNRYDLARQAYRQIFDLLIKKGEISPKIDPNQLANLMIALMDGLQIQWLLDPENVDMIETFVVFTEILSNFLVLEND